MFDYPLFLPHHTLYEEFGLDPEATAQEIQDALDEKRGDLRKQQLEIGTLLSTIYKDVPDLKEAENEISSLRLENAKVAPEEREAKLRIARKRLEEAEHRALEINPEFHHLREQADQLKRKEEDLNSNPLSDTNKRAEYDRDHAPLELFKLADCERNDLFDRSRPGTALIALRRELAAFFTEQGEETFHPSDLTREDFSSDFDPSSYLDGA